MIGKHVVKIGADPTQTCDRDVQAHRGGQIVGDRTGQHARLFLDDRLETALHCAQRDPGEHCVGEDQSACGDDADAQAERGEGRRPARVGVHRPSFSADASAAAVSRTFAR